MANYANPFASAQGADTSQGYMNGVGGGWADYTGAGAQMQFGQMLPGQAAGTWFQGQGYSDAMWYASQGGYADASMFSALAAKLQVPQNADQLWLQPMMAQQVAASAAATAPQAQTQMQQLVQRQLMQNQSPLPVPAGTRSTPDPSGKGTHPAKSASPAKAPPPPGISGTTPIKAGTSVSNPTSDKSAALKAALNQGRPAEPRTDEAGAKAGQFLLNLVNNKEERPGAILLQQLKGGASRGKAPADLSAFRTDNGAGMALLQQVKAGTPSTEQPKSEQWSSSNNNKGRGQGGWWGGDSYYGSYDENEWADHRKGAGKYKYKGKTSGKHDWAGWNGSESWWTSNSGEEWLEESQNYWTERQRSAPQWGRTKKGGKGKSAVREYEEEEEEETSEELPTRDGARRVKPREKARAAAKASRRPQLLSPRRSRSGSRLQRAPSEFALWNFRRTR